MEEKVLEITFADPAELDRFYGLATKLGWDAEALAAKLCTDFLKTANPKAEESR